MINNGVIIIRYGHSVVIPSTNDNNHNQQQQQQPMITTLAQRLVAELHRSDTLLNNNNNNNVSPIHIKTKYFEAELSCVIASDNLVFVEDESDHVKKEDGKAKGEKNNRNDMTTTEEIVASLKCARIPYGIVQLVDMAKCSSQSLIRDQDLSSSSSDNHIKKADAPLFNLCLVIASSDDEKNDQTSSTNNTISSQLPKGQQHLFQKWREICVDNGVECVPWILDGACDANNNNDLATPRPPPIGIEKRSLLQSMKEGKELTGSSRVLEVLNQSMWASLDPMLLMKLKQREMTLNNETGSSSSLFEGVYQENLIGLVSSSRYTCEFTKQLFDRLLITEEEQEEKEDQRRMMLLKGNTKLYTRQEFDGKNSQNENTKNLVFVGSGGDEQNFSVEIFNHHQQKRNSSLLNFYFTPFHLLQMSSSNDNDSNANLSSLSCPASALNISVTELKKMVSIPSCKLIMFHLLMTDLEMMMTTICQALRTILSALRKLDKETSGEYLKRIQLEDNLNCLIVIEDNNSTSSSSSRFHKDDEEYQNLVSDLMQAGCEVVLVSPSSSENNNDDEKNRFYDKTEGTVDIARISEVLSMIPWKSVSDSEQQSVEQLKKQNPISKNCVLLIVPNDDDGSSSSLTKKVSKFISRSFSNDEDESLSSAHEKKTEWLSRRINSNNNNNNNLINVYSNIELSTKYYSTAIDVIVMFCGGSTTTSSSDDLIIKQILFWTEPQVLMMYGSSSSSSSSSFLETTLKNVCKIQENEEQETEKSSISHHEKPEDHHQHLIGPETSNIALVVLDGDNNKNDKIIINSSLLEYCQENFIEILPHQDGDGDDSSKQQKQKQIIPTLTMEVYDSLSCVEWKVNVNKKKENSSASASSSGTDDQHQHQLARNIHYQNTVLNTTSTATATATAAATSKSVIDAAALVNDKEKETKTSSDLNYFTCAIPPKTHYYDKKLKKTMLRGGSATMSSDHGKNNGEDDEKINEGEDEDDDDDNDMSDLLQQMREVRDSKRLTREERQKQAEELSKQFAKRLHKDDELADAIAKNIV